MKRVYSVLFATVMVLSAFTPSLAQSPSVQCGALAADDCAILEAAAAADATVTESSYQLGFEFGVVGIPDLPIDELQMRWEQNASYSSDVAYMAERLVGVDAEALAAMETDALAAYVGAVVDAVDTAQTVTLTLSRELAEALSSDAPMPIPEQMTLSYRIVDGIGYVNLDDIAAIVPDMAGVSGWAGTELAPVLAAILERAATDSDLQEALAPLAIVVGAAMAGQNMATEQQAFLSQFVNVERGEDVSFAEGQLAQFVSSVDFVEMATSPGFMDVILSQSAMLEQMGQEGISADDLAEIEFIMPMIAPMLFNGLFYETQQFVDLENAYTIGKRVDMNWDLSSLVRLAAMQSGDPSSAPSGDVEFGFVYVVESADQNDVGPITAPDAALVVPAELVIQAMAEGS